jgi:hypothetical protein
MIVTTAADALVNGARRFTSLRFFSRSEPLRSAWEVIAWWEARRVPFNLMVGVTGIVTGAIILFAALLAETYLGEPIGLPDPPIFVVFGIVFYAILANICFAGGWAVELLVSRIWGEQAHSFGPISFILGILFSIALTLAPAVLVIGVVLVRMVLHMFGLA